MSPITNVKKIIYLLAIVICCSLAASFSHAGGVDTGGGSIVTTITGETGLIDYFTHAPELFGKIDKRPKLKVTSEKNESKNFGGLEIYKVSLQSIGALQSLSDRINVWKVNSPAMVNYLNMALQNIPIYFVNKELTFVDHSYYIPECLKNRIASINTVAFYQKIIGLIISKPEFEVLSYEDQLGLLMKEVIRHVQITFETELSPEEIQELNAALALGPTSRKSIDLILYFSEKVQSQILNKQRITTEKKELFNDVCLYSQKYELNFCQISDTNEAIGKLSARLDQAITSDESYQIRLLLRRAFVILDSEIVLKISDSNDPSLYDAIQSLNFEKLIFDFFIKN